ncbi:RDD family protein [Candidatus Cyanaurora vandensis]|uniref:RDD family protein n=1 Tax=Candidatus Cyanaurora vandensis TaxID=2714958 RepID=UPI00257AD08D|nr:RDD family protein [Candidatus Cyanaurora vandensis]
MTEPLAGVYRIRTPENIDLTFRLAGVGERFLAYLVDFFINTSLFITLWLLLLLVGVGGLDLNGIGTFLGSWLGAVIFALAGLLNVGYYLYFELVWQGQTPGKRWTGLRVLRDDGRPLDLRGNLIRNLVRLVDQTFALGLVVLVLHPEEKRLGDLAAGTIVVKEVNPGTLTPPIVATDTAILNLNLRRLNPQDYFCLEEFLSRRLSLEPRARVELAQRLAQRYLALVGEAELPGGMDAEAFLVGVYEGYRGGG